jgi:hypothetical protein
LLCSAAHALPLLEAGNRWLRADVEALADAGILTSPITQYPMPWGALSADLEKAMETGVPEAVRPAFLRVFKAYRRASRPWQGSVDVSSATARDDLRGFGDGSREKGELGLSVDVLGETLAARIGGQVVQDPYDGEDVRWDGSYLGAVWGDWIVSAAAVDRWWGPGWSASLVMSDNARPIPAISLQRLGSSAPETSWLQWIGPWSLETFVGQMESERAIPDARIWGARAAFKPFPELEIGLSRTAIWGGEGRPQDLQAFWNVLIGNDNIGADLARNEEPGNQMAGVDVRWRLASRLGVPLVFYMQYIGEDKLIHLIPSKATTHYGLSWQEPSSAGLTQTWYLEYYNTTTSGFQSVRTDNTIYEHHLYASGYRYYGRTLGASWDNDAAVWTLGWVASDHDSNEWSVQLGYFDLNRDGGNKGRPGGNPLTETAVDLWQLDTTWRHYFASWYVELNLTARTKALSAFTGNYEDFRSGRLSPEGDKYRAELALRWEF